MSTYKISIESLYKNCILGTIAQSIWLLKSRIKIEEQYWDKFNYCISDTNGSYGTISFFDKRILFAAFFDRNSKLSPFNSSIDNYSANSFFSSAPKQIKDLALNHTLQYLLQEYKGRNVPVITSCFWSEKNIIVSKKSYAQDWDNGLSLIRIQLIDSHDEAMAEWQDNFELTDMEITLVNDIYLLKVNNLYDKVYLSTPILEKVKSINKDIILTIEHLKSIGFVINE